jgi:hypothetical protein
MPVALGFTVTLTLTGEPLGSDTDAGAPKVPSLPTHVSWYATLSPGPLFRVKVYCRVYD